MNQRPNCQHWLDNRKARECQKNVHLSFTDYATVFDCMNHNKLWKNFKEMTIPDHFNCLLKKLYASQEATIRTRYMLQLTGSNLGKEYIEVVCCQPTYLTYMQSESYKMTD